MHGVAAPGALPPPPPLDEDDFDFGPHAAATTISAAKASNRIPRTYHHPRAIHAR
jgi:hypothetical protein